MHACIDDVRDGCSSFFVVFLIPVFETSYACASFVLETLLFVFRVFCVVFVENHPSQLNEEEDKRRRIIAKNSF